MLRGGPLGPAFEVSGQDGGREGEGAVKKERDKGCFGGSFRSLGRVDFLCVFLGDGIYFVGEFNCCMG